MSSLIQAYYSSTTDFQVLTIAIQSDGKIIVGGNFNTWHGNTVNRIVRLNSDGTRDTAFTTNTGTAANNSVTAVKVQSDGKILVGGYFTTWNGTTVNRIVRLNADGTRDTAFTTNTGTGTDARISAIIVQSDGKIIIAGEFTTWNGTAVKRIVRLNADGTRDTAFTGTENSSLSPYTSYESLALQPDGKILGGVSKRVFVDGGSFFYTVITAGVVRMTSTGAQDTAFNSNSSTTLSDATAAIAVQTDNKIIAGGGFTTWNGTTVNRIVRLNADGTRDTAFTTNTGTGFNGYVNTIAVQSDGKIIIGGNFTALNGTTVNGIVRLNANGTRDTAFTTNTGTGFGTGVAGLNSIDVQSDGKIIVAGDFTTWNGVTATRFIRLSSSGVLDTTYPKGWRTVTMIYTKVAGVWKPAKAGYTKVAGVWRNWWLQ